MKDFSSELKYRTARSSGKGGQNVNKVESMVEAIWNVQESLFFSEEEKALIKTKLANRINKQGQLPVKSQLYRTQLQNKEAATNKILELVAQSLYIPKVRKQKQIPKAVIEKRLKLKKKVSEQKKLRSNRFWL